MLGIGKGYVYWRGLRRPPFSYRLKNVSLTLLHLEQPKLHRVLAVLSAIGLKKLLIQHFVRSYSTHKINRCNIFC